MAGGLHHHRTNIDRFHPGYFGKVGMRHFHLTKNAHHVAAVNIDKLWSLVPAEVLASGQVPVVDALKAGFTKVLAKGKLSLEKPIVVKARFFSRRAEEKIKAAGGACVLVA